MRFELLVLDANLRYRPHRERSRHHSLIRAPKPDKSVKNRLLPRYARERVLWFRPFPQGTPRMAAFIRDWVLGDSTRFVERQPRISRKWGIHFSITQVAYEV